MTDKQDSKYYAKIFMQKLREYSRNKEDPIPEWKFHSNHQTGIGTWCICTKNIYNVHVIQNKYDPSLMLEIGGDCAKKWFDCSLNCKHCDRPLKNTIKRREEQNHYCVKCTNNMRKLQDYNLFVKGFGYESFFQHAQNENLITFLVNKKKDELNYSEKFFIEYCSYFYKW